MTEHVDILPAPAPGVVCAIWREVAAGACVPSTVPASTYACLNVIARGAVRLAEDGSALPTCFLTGPFCQPIRTETVGPMRSLSLVLPAWLLPAWFGVAPPALAHGLLALPHPALDLLLAAVDERSHLAAALAALAKPASAAERRAQALADALLHAGAVAAAAHACQLSARHFERRFLAAHGLRPREWLRVRRFEQSLLQLAQSPSLAQLAAERGYADQAHMSRDFRYAAGLAPRLAKGAMLADTAGFWAFRPARLLG
ncbi:helix-turn-helix domain-containing protein [Massilia sp. TS11]|uniref:AraC family transcriptional regulator n=1 Tax=Massilia sp. TS11 TaxID=2908003 RepID=UPI001EDAC411|nr:helix-turn-helix domain-containing protein [Massilia sp. TS11]MCG2586627.1 helix-turn-helix domain-containing protein [Massilia sp. TS11]